VRPVDEPTLATPSDGYRAPSDVERIFEGRLAGASLKRGSAGPIGPGGARLIGAAGFELE
jgi:pilus assembly protein CpaC